jgi:Serine dehydrogenase proteinase/Thioredoxin
LRWGGNFGLSEVGLRDALAQRRFADKLNADFVGGVRSGVNGTPSFFINGVKHQGSYSFDELAAAIDARLHVRAPRHRALVARVRKKRRKLTTVMVARAAQSKLRSPAAGTTRQDDLSPCLERQRTASGTVFVPHYAMSGGTQIALAADEIVMCKHSVLGPIDPQLGQLPAASLLKVIEQKPASKIDDNTFVMAEVGRKAITQVKEAAQELLSHRLSPTRRKSSLKSFRRGRGRTTARSLLRRRRNSVCRSDLPNEVRTAIANIRATMRDRLFRETKGVIPRS